MPPSRNSPDWLQCGGRVPFGRHNPKIPDSPAMPSLSLHKHGDEVRMRQRPYGFDRVSVAAKLLSGITFGNQNPQSKIGGNIVWANPRSLRQLRS